MSHRALKYVLAVCLLLGTAFSTNYEDVRAETESAAIFLPVEIPHTLIWDKCGRWNGMYFRAWSLILLCEENLTYGPKVSRFVYLHELGHAYTFAHPEFDYSRWGKNYEAAADEFAAVSAVVQGHPEDILAMAKLFEEAAKSQKWDPSDPHPPAIKRARTLKSLYYGAMIPWGPIGAPWREALGFWTAEFRRTAWNN